MTQQLILIAGPYRSGTESVQARIDENLVGDEISEAMLYPVAHRLIAKCDAIYRIAGASKGADMDIEVARKYGLSVYTALENIPEA